MMRRFAALVLCLVFCCTMIPAALADEPSGVEDGVLTVAMECNYAPYNWSQGDDSNGAVPIRDSREYANGYDVMMAKKLCEANGWQLEIVRLDWDSLVPAVQAGVVDAVIAGQSMTASRAEMVDFAGPYLYASIVCLAKQGTPQAAAKGISELSGYCTSQLGTIWYDRLPAADCGREDSVSRRVRPRHADGAGSGHGGFHLHRYAHCAGRAAGLSRSGAAGFQRQRG